MSTKKWPTAAGRISKTITLRHAQAWAGNPDLHDHQIIVTFGWRHEINPNFGHTWPVAETQHKIDKVCALVDSKSFNDLIPEGTQPTVETLACWLLVRTPAFWDWCEIQAYGDYAVRVERGDIPKAWTEKYLGGAATEALTV